MGVVVGVAVMFPHPRSAVAATIDLGSASGFSILAGSAITAAGGSTIYGDVGLSPTTGAAIGVTAGQVHGTIYAVDGAGPAGSVDNPSLLTQAKNDLGTAYTAAAGSTPTTSYSTPEVFGNQTLNPGVYHGDSSLEIGGTLTLDAHGNPNAVWIFQATASTLTADVGSKVLLTGGAQAGNVFWQVGSSATLETSAQFEGTILANTSITADSGATVVGRLLAENGAVTFNGNTISAVPDAGGTLLLLSSGVAALFAFRRRFLEPA
jgi:hypothetical protein